MNKEKVKDLGKRLGGVVVNGVQLYADKRDQSQNVNDQVIYSLMKTQEQVLKLLEEQQQEIKKLQNYVEILVKLASKVES